MPEAVYFKNQYNKDCIPNKILSERKLEYLVLAGLGFNNKEISDLLCVSLSTVKKTLEDIYLKLNALDRANAVLIACVHNLISNEYCHKVLRQYPHAEISRNLKLKNRKF